MSNNWVLALLWCSSASGEESPLWKGCFVMYHVEILMGLERGMSWSTSGPVRRSFPNERWKGWFPTRVSLSLIYLLSKTFLWFPFLALVDNSEFKWLLRPLWAHVPELTWLHNFNICSRESHWYFLLWASAGWWAKCFVYVRYTIRNVWYSMFSLRSQHGLTLVLAPTQHTCPSSCQILGRNTILPLCSWLPQLGFPSQHVPLSWLKCEEVPWSKWTAHVSLWKWGLLDSLSGSGRNAGNLKCRNWGGLEAFAPCWQPCWSQLKSPSHGGKWLLLLGRAAPFSKVLGCAFLTSACLRIQLGATERGLFL